MLGCIPWPGPLMSQALLHKGLGGMCGSTPSVETPQIFDTGGCNGTCPDQGGGHYGYPARVGSHPQGQNCERGVGSTPPFHPHKFPGAPSSISGPEDLVMLQSP